MQHIFKSGVIVVGILLATVSLSSCNLAKNQLAFDRGLNKDLQDFRDGLSPDETTKPEQNVAAAPDFQSVVSTPADLKLPSPLVTVSVNQTVSLRDLLFELAEQAGVDIEMDPQIRGSIIFTAKDRPFDEVIDRISAMAGLRYTFEQNVLRIEVDRPYVKNYKVDYMSTARKSSSDISTGISSSSASGSSTGAPSTSGGSNSKVENANDNDFWKDIDTGLKQILAASDTYKALASQEDPVAVAEPPPPMPAPVDANGQPIPGAVPPPSNVPPSLNVTTPTAAAPADGATATAGTATYTISRQTGIVSVFATERQHKLVQKFMDHYRREATTQILIEAKVLEVTLNDQFATGINWVDFNRLVNGGVMQFNKPAFTPPDGGLDSAGAGAFVAGIDVINGINPVVTALSKYGTVRSLSSPRVTVMNNQSAVVNVAENLVYFNIRATVTPATDTSNATITYDSTQQSVPEGVLLNVTPTANADTGEVMMAVRPTVSKKVGEVNDPSVALNIIANGGAAGDVPDSPIPEMSVQEIDSVIKMQSGQTMVMGGLMRDANSIVQEGVPVLGDLPLVGTLFRNHGDQVNKSELVIFLKATIVPGANVQDADRKVYKKFGNDTRPFDM